MNKTILSLYDYSGNWSHYYKKNNYEVIQIDRALNGEDVRLMKYISTRQIHGILAATPCTYFSQARKRPGSFELLDGLSTADAVMRMVVLYKPKFYCIENPAKSRLWHYYGNPRQIVQWNWFGLNCKKPTGLYGDFNIVQTISQLANINTKRLDNLSKLQRNTTPLEFGRLFFESNK